MYNVFPPAILGVILSLAAVMLLAPNQSKIMNHDSVDIVENTPVELAAPTPPDTVSLQPVLLSFHSVQSKPTVNQRHVQCMAEAIYWEARGESLLGKIAVARVVMNRIVHGLAGDPCAVVYQKRRIYNKETNTSYTQCQFSWVCEPRRRVTDHESMDEARWIATEVLAYNNWSVLLPSNLLFFHATTVRPGWRYNRYRKIDNNIFYTMGRPHYTQYSEHGL